MTKLSPYDKWSPSEYVEAHFEVNFVKKRFLITNPSSKMGTFLQGNSLRTTYNLSNSANLNFQWIEAYADYANIIEKDELISKGKVSETVGNNEKYWAERGTNDALLKVGSRDG